MPTRVDAVILTNTASEAFHDMTRTTLETLNRACDGLELRSFVVESNPGARRQGLVYDGCVTLTPEGDFNYNTFMLHGLRAGDSEYALMCNNDLIFEQGSVAEIVRAMQEGGFESASPYEPNWHTRYYGSQAPRSPVIGYDIEHHVCGWCICATRSMLEAVRPLDERFSFWCQDSDYAMTLMRQGVRHALIPSSRVRHEFSRSHGLLGDRHQEMTHGQMQIMADKWGSI